MPNREGKLERIIGVSKKELSERTGIREEVLEEIEGNLPPEEFMSKLRIRVIPDGNKIERRLVSLLNKYNYSFSKRKRFNKNFGMNSSPPYSRKRWFDDLVVKTLIKKSKIKQIASGRKVKFDQDIFPMSQKVYVLEHEDLGPIGVLNIDPIKNRIITVSTNRGLVEMLERHFSDRLGKKIRLPVATILKLRVFSEHNYVWSFLTHDGAKLNKYLKRSGVNIRFFRSGVGLGEYIFISPILKKRKKLK